MKVTIWILVLAAASATSAVASSFAGLCDTGVVTGCASQTPLATNVQDGNFTVTASPGVGAPPFPAYTIGGPTNGYYTSGGNSIGTSSASWVTTATGTPPTDTTAVGTFNYQEAIRANYTGPVTITGQWAVDNCGTLAWGSTPVAVTGSGVTIGGGVSNCMTSSSTFGALTSFSFQESVVSGTTYYLDFEVGNTGLVTGLLVNDLAASATPEPSSVSLALAGLASLSAGMIRRRRTVMTVRARPVLIMLAALASISWGAEAKEKEPTADSERLRG